MAYGKVCICTKYLSLFIYSKRIYKESFLVVAKIKDIIFNDRTDIVVIYITNIYSY